ncbi:TPA: hypothetical protein ACGUON_003507 [Vibrio vulnificus]|uniref:Uncharacterized protein n=1 Tax=Vibrio vulnificus (strain CMCP6) TaxID=216895 RepID=A0A3Q0L1Y0_VIBVU|nr:hypothetical protein [Vibrio vulnificus]AAO08919.1 hypothetical protein VV1_0396 [Vibrio vulnificus CMCP6]QBN13185.1 hypothetical protein E2I22_02660 [Vibrio vulnificus]
MLIPNTAQTVDFVFELLDLKLSKNKKIAIDSRSEFESQNEIFKEKCVLITSALSSDDPDIWLYIDQTIGTLLGAMQELNLLLGPLARDEANQQKNRAIFISYWCIPYAISAIGKLEGRIDRESPLSTMRTWLIEILQGSDDVRKATKSKSCDVESFIRQKLALVLPRGVSGDIKSDLASNKGWKSISYCDELNKNLLEKFQADLVGRENAKLLPQIRSVVKAGGVLRKAIKGIDFEELTISDADEVMLKMDNFLLSFEKIQDNFETGTETDASDSLIEVFNYLESNLVKETSQHTLKNIHAINELVGGFPTVAANNGFEYILLILHEHMADFEGFDPTLLQSVIDKSKHVDDNTYGIIISNAHERARQEFINFIEKVRKSSSSSQQLLVLSCIVLAISLVCLQTVQHNKMTKLIAAIRNCLSSFGDFVVLPPFSTPFDRRTKTLIDINRFNEDSQLIAYSIKVYNMRLIESLHVSDWSGKLILPFWHMDFQLEEFIDSYHNGKFDKTKAKVLTKPNRFWRVDRSSVYEVLRDIEFYIEIFGVKLKDGNAIVPPSVDKYLRLTDGIKKKALKVLSPKEYEKDNAASKRSIKARRAGEKSYIGSDGLPVFILNK